ncbi:MAG: phosphatidylglycerol---prolipoprotein diacylglyceryl transferase, partial [Clostridia bacterium]|nr:phosphatidylglycerol---prolipoprotein diacylglyceryl transferase [Clostridia bacterium]
MDPIAFRIGPLTVRWYGILISTALAIGTYLAYKEAERQQIHPDHVLNIVIVAAPLAFVGARIYYVLFRWSEYY